MPDFAVLGAERAAQSEIDAAVSTGKLVTAPGAANTKGAWTELIASTAFTASGLLVQLFMGTSDAATLAADALVDIGIGPAGSEVVLVPNLIQSVTRDAANNTFNVTAVYLPVQVPAGTRVAMRYQSSHLTGTSLRAAVMIVGQGFLPSQSPQRMVAWGANLADSGGTSVDPGGTANAFGAYTELVASTEVPIVGLLIGLGNQQNDARTGTNWGVKVGIGAAGSEVHQVSIYLARANGTDSLLRPTLGLSPFPCSVPAGSRVSVAAACQITDVTDRLLDVVLYGLVA